MGELNQHNLSQYIKKYGCKYFIETGTGIGTGLEYALKSNFNNYFSIEINKTLYEKAKIKFIKYNNIAILNMDSITGLGTAISCLKTEEPILFWLDAHFPGADFQLGSYDDIHTDSIKYPLESELMTIFSKRIKNKDVFIIDDLQLYENGDYELKLNPDFIRKHKRNINSIIEIVNKTHNISRDYRHQGFLILEPKNEF